MNIALLGYGKMGKMVEQCILKEQKHRIVLKVNSSNRHATTNDELKKADVAIEFSNPASAIENIMWCFDAGIPLVTGTTGWYDQMESVKKACDKKNGSMVFASNFSIGVNIFFELNRKLGELMKSRPEYTPRLTEIHHPQKKDAPSGTAITLANDTLKESAVKKQWVNHETANSSDLIILSRREEGVTGIHTIEYFSPVDKIQITHEAFSREGFAKGAVLAAGWIAGKKGFYEFREILNEL